MRLIDTREWIDPQRLFSWAKRFGNVRALLHSSAYDADIGRYSWLACDPAEHIADLGALQEGRFLSQYADNPAANNWFGYIGYEALRLVEPSVPVSRRAFLRLPDVWLCRFRRVYRFDALKGLVEYYGEPGNAGPFFPKNTVDAPRLPPVPRLRAFKTLMPKTAYLRRVEAILEHIRAGDIFQANLTRKHIGAFASPPGPEAVYAKLSAASPGHYAAHLAAPFANILSSSPERFITVSPSGEMRASPIKGTAPRFLRDPAKDLAGAEALRHSEKDRAENVMIVDLTRNDLSRSCLPGSVRTEELCAVRSFATVHHLISTVTGQKRPDVSGLGAVMAAFPPGSMTGAPKPHAMKICHRYENIKRGVYAGAIGRFGGDGSADFSVVIRTLILRGIWMECQTGGGIVADSNPYAELRETAAKLRGVAKALGQEERMIAELL